MQPVIGMLLDQQSTVFLCIHSTDTSGKAVFTSLPLNRQKIYNVIISARSITGQSVSISREVRIETSVYSPPIHYLDMILKYNFMLF